ncbi:LysM peptidoglycan-binding domain-containing protein [Acidovorax sp. SUPP950]|uniref:LysM peptidoglycan-binding domain-containing protein n=1 Tax=Acidovorax sp. SUPP950 TaxID=511901 RepID=UPI0023C44DD3|nr:LysM peptidoglycan-binding domain-containing protein [Acidovorax sp. SUPP950]GKS75332.1 LysM peptidoglycan-binding domain-containing protein [Acidovorax sp. SUPP950]
MSAAVNSPPSPSQATAPSSDAKADTDSTPVGYSDAVLGIASWPSTTMAWRFLPASAETTGATLAVNIAMRPEGLLPAPTAAGDAAAAMASEVATRFEAIMWQLVQPDMQLSLATSLNQPAGGTPIQMPVEIPPLRAYAAACHAFSQAAATLGVAMADPVAAATLADVYSHYGVDWQAMGLAARDRTIGTLVHLPPEGLWMPSYAAFVAGGTVAALVAEDLDPAAVLTDPNNISLPLNPGIELAIPTTDQTQPTGGLPLSVVAATLHLTPASLVAANYTRPALLAPGFVFEAEGVAVQVPAEGDPGADACLNDIAHLFSDKGVPIEAAMVALANADKPGMFRPGITLAVDRRLIEAGWTLADNPTGIAMGPLARLNVGTVDLLPAGSALLLKTTLTTGLDAEPLGALAHAHAIGPGDLLRHNAGLAVRDLPVPGLAAWPGTSLSLRIPYRVRAGQTLSTIAGLFVPAAATDTEQTDEQALCETNRSMPATLAPGQVIIVAGQPLTTQSGDSFDTLVARANPAVTLDEFATAIATDPEALAAGALLLCPPAVLASATTPEDLAIAYGLSATALLSANAATPKLIVPSVLLKPSQVADEPTIETAQGDSIHAIIRRFALAGNDVSIEDLVRANQCTAFLAAGAQLLLPPVDTVLRAAFGAGGWQLPGAIFPLRTWVTLKRDADKVPPALRGTTEAPGAAVQDSSVVVSVGNGIGDGQESNAVALGQLAVAIESTVIGLKLAMVHGTTPADVWGISFVDPGGIAEVKVSPQASVPGVEGLQPLSFALRPLSNTLEHATGVEIRSIDETTGGWGASTVNDYQGIDLEAWARIWLAGLDQLCTGRHAVPAAQVAPEALARLMTAKKVLSRAVANGLSPVLVIQEASLGALDSEAWQAAREALQQRLQDQLLSGYDTAAILQFNAAVTSPATASMARLWGTGRVGNPQAAGAHDSVADDPSAWKICQLGNAATALANTRKGTVSFPLDVDQPALHRAVALQPDYAVHDMEVAGQLLENDSGKPKRLSFLRDFERFPPAAFSAPLGTTVVPVPLRACPNPPLVVSHQAEGPTDPATLAEALHWSYVFTHAHDNAAQDQALIEIEFNGQPPVATDLGNRGDNALFQALAQYTAVQEPLWAILEQLQAPSVSPKDPVLVTALHAFADLAERVGALWSDWWPSHDSQDSPPATHCMDGHRAPHLSGSDESTAHGVAMPSLTDASVPHECYQYLATLHTTTAAGDGTNPPAYCKLTLQRLQADGPLAWPEITILCADGVNLPLIGAKPMDQSRDYNFPAGEGVPNVPAFTPVSCQWTLSGLHVARYQRANATVAVIRNAQLLGTDGALTCPAFVYRTPQTGFSEPLIPLIRIDTPLPIGIWTDDVATNPLTPLFNALFDSDETGREIMVRTTYGYRVASSTPAIETLTPVMFLPLSEFNATSTVQSIIGAFEAWRTNTGSPTHGGFLTFEIRLYAHAGLAHPQPLVVLQQIVSALA